MKNAQGGAPRSEHRRGAQATWNLPPRTASAPLNLSEAGPPATPVGPRPLWTPVLAYIFLRFATMAQQGVAKGSRARDNRKG